jgi:tetratricopeptide (TPR) repeat protein
MARLQLRMTTDPVNAIGATEVVAREALEVFTAAGDDRGLALAWLSSFWAEWIRSRAQPALAALESAIEIADRAGEVQIANRAIQYMLGPLFHGPLSPDEVRARIGPLRARGGAFAEQSALMAEAYLLRFEGRFEEARELFRQADAVRRDLGLEVISIVLLQFAAEIEVLSGRIAEGVALLRKADAGLAALGETSFRSTIIVRLGWALYEQGELDEAELRATEGEELGAAEDVVNYALGRSVRAMIAADRGRTEDAERLAGDSLQYALLTDFPFVHASAHKAIARAAASAGRLGDARAAVDRAVELYESVGDVVEANRARLLLVEP